MFDEEHAQYWNNCNAINVINQINKIINKQQTVYTSVFHLYRLRRWIWLFDGHIDNWMINCIKLYIKSQQN